MLVLGEVLLLLAVLALTVWVLSTPAPPPQDERLERALAGLRRQQPRLGRALRGMVGSALRYGRELRGLRREMSELERHLAAPQTAGGSAGSTARERLQERYRQLGRTYEEGVELLESLEAELLLWQGPETPKGFAELEALRSSLRELLSRPADG
ncbi:hypothetical protein Mterra_01701 [Calidithermus terrae]|uniref:Uncharacterized protein n=1 Tax=Calidithermus terrae TaxID=1408545 RepID=A0A399EPK1_9DEIN|nr:hypothetical protein [Calidithermus terrae]RIH85463.1 hypothetical protein Mterra_01701 [Calidithermus terrae]